MTTFVLFTTLYTEEQHVASSYEWTAFPGREVDYRYATITFKAVDREHESSFKIEFRCREHDELVG